MILKYSSLAIAISFGEIGFRVSTSLKGRARGLHSCSECSPQHACIIVDIYVYQRVEKKCLTCARIFTYMHTRYTLQFHLFYQDTTVQQTSCIGSYTKCLLRKMRVLSRECDLCPFLSMQINFNLGLTYTFYLFLILRIR